MTALVVIWVALLIILTLVYFFPPYRTSRDMVKLYRVKPKREAPRSESEPNDQRA